MEKNDILLSRPAEVGSDLIDDIPASRIGIQKLCDMKPTVIVVVQQVVMHVVHIVEAAIELANVSGIVVYTDEQCVNLIRHSAHPVVAKHDLNLGGRNPGRNLAGAKSSAELKTPYNTGFG
jgi:hypothetical protein